MDTHRHKNVQLKIALRSGHAHRHIVAHDLHRHHGDGLALGGIDLAGHNGGAGFVFRNADLSQSVAGAGSQPPHVVGDLHHVAGQSLQRSVGKYQLILGGQGVKFVGRRQEDLAGDPGNGVGHLRVKSGRCVQSGTHSSTAQRQLLQRRQRQQQQLLVPLQAGAPPGDLLGKGDRGGVLQMRAAGFDHAAVVLLQPAHGGAQPVDSRDHPILKRQHRSNVHGSGKGVVG